LREIVKEQVSRLIICKITCMCMLYLAMICVKQNRRVDQHPRLDVFCGKQEKQDEPDKEQKTCQPSTPYPRAEIQFFPAFVPFCVLSAY